MGDRFQDLKNALMRMEVEPSKLAKDSHAYNRLVSPAVNFNSKGKEAYPGVKVTEERVREWARQKAEGSPAEAADAATKLSLLNASGFAIGPIQVDLAMGLAFRDLVEFGKGLARQRQSDLVSDLRRAAATKRAEGASEQAAELEGRAQVIANTGLPNVEVLGVDAFIKALDVSARNLTVEQWSVIDKYKKTADAFFASAEGAGLVDKWGDRAVQVVAKSMAGFEKSYGVSLSAESAEVFASFGKNGVRVHFLMPPSPSSWAAPAWRGRGGVR